MLGILRTVVCEVVQMSAEETQVYSCEHTLPDGFERVEWQSDPTRVHGYPSEAMP
jgi:hypothetical protein